MQEWKSVKNKRESPEAIIKCDSCNRDIFLHPNYIKGGVIGCQRVGCKKKVDTEKFVKSMLEFRKCQFVKIEKEKYKGGNVFFICDKGHSTSIGTTSLCKGGCCKVCQKQLPKKKRVKEEQTETERVSCDCKIKNLGAFRGPSYICQHYNHAVIYPDSAKEWNYSLNGNATPEKIAPKTKQKYWFTCKDCSSNYHQCICDRALDNARCPYCSGHKTNGNNCLSTTHPYLIKEWSDKNILTPEEVTPGSEKIAIWNCYNHEDVFEYEAMIKDRTGKKSSCPKCFILGFEQREGGHEHFVKEARKTHGDKYEYIENYVSGNVKVKILCKEHGIFKQTPQQHKRGQGCPYCGNIESKLVTNIRKILEENKIPYETEVSFEGMECISKLRIDFLVLNNIAIEADGSQHFKCSESWGGDGNLKKTKERDIIKDTYCMQKGISMFRIPYTEEFTQDTLQKILEYNEKEQQFYRTYQEYYDIVSENINLNDVEIDVIEAPEK